MDLLFPHSNSILTCVATQSAVYAMAILSVCPFVHHICV